MEGMLMQNLINATDVRREWGKFIDDVVRDKPKIVKRNRDLLFALSIEHLDEILRTYKLDLQIEKEEDEDAYIASTDIFDVFASGFSIDEAIANLADELIEYAQEYMNNFQLYYNAPNRKSHFPYILRILTQKNRDGVISLFNA